VSNARYPRRGRTIDVCSLLLAAALGLGMSAPATGKPKPWSLLIPPGREAITLSIRSLGKVPTRVTWGRRLLGETPLVLKWPRDSGPVDIVVKAQGYVPVHTRLYTFADDRVVVKLVDDEGKKTVFGYKREAPPPAAAASAPGSPLPLGAAPQAAASGAVAAPQGTAPSGAAPPISAPPGAASQGSASPAVVPRPPPAAPLPVPTPALRAP
jgi:hypothetical protein